MCTSTDFQPDFYNNAAAIAVVLMLAKLVTHRVRRKVRTQRTTLVLWAVHLAAVVAAGLTVVASMIATHSRCDNHALTWWTGAALAVAGVIVVVDDLVENLPRLRRGDGLQTPVLAPGDVAGPGQGSGI